MANKPPAFQFYVKDWLSSESVVVMTAEQRGWYIQLLCHAWNSEPIATLPADDRKLKALAGAAESWATEKQAVLDCFEVEGDRLVNRRLANQFKEMEEFRNSKSEAGRKGNEMRWNKNRTQIAERPLSDDSAIADHRPSTATASSTAASVRLSSAEGNRQQSAETGDSRSKALDPHLVKFWAENVSNWWPGKTITATNLPKATAQCDKYFAMCGEAKRKVVLAAWERSKHPVSSGQTDQNLKPLELTEVCRCSDPAPDTCGDSLLDYGSSCKVCGLFLDPPAGYYSPVPNPYHKSLRATAAAAATPDDVELPKSKAFQIED